MPPEPTPAGETTQEADPVGTAGLDHTVANHLPARGLPVAAGLEEEALSDATVPRRTRWIPVTALVAYLVCRVATAAAVAVADLSTHNSVVFDLTRWDGVWFLRAVQHGYPCLLYTSPSPRDRQKSRMPSSA